MIPTPDDYAAGPPSHVLSGPLPALVTCRRCGGDLPFVPDVDSVRLTLDIAHFSRRHASCPEGRAPIAPAGPSSGVLGEMLTRKAGDVVACVYDHTTREAAIASVYTCQACAHERYVCEDHVPQSVGARVLCTTIRCRQFGKALRLVDGPPEVQAALKRQATRRGGVR